MDERISDALARGGTVDITTTGRKSGLPRRMEIGFTNLEGRLFIWGGSPGRRDWLANMLASPRFTLHLKSLPADLPARARVVTDESERREIFAKLGASPDRLDAMVQSHPLVEFVIDR